MPLAFLNPLYEHPGSWASAYIDTSLHTEDQQQRRHPSAEAITRELARQGADEPTCRAVHDALEALRHAPEPYGRAVFAQDGEVVLEVPLTRGPRTARRTGVRCRM